MSFHRILHPLGIRDAQQNLGALLFGPSSMINQQSRLLLPGQSASKSFTLRMYGSTTQARILSQLPRRPAAAPNFRQAIRRKLNTEQRRGLFQALYRRVDGTCGICNGISSSCNFVTNIIRLPRDTWIYFRRSSAVVQINTAAVFFSFIIYTFLFNWFSARERALSIFNSIRYLGFKIGTLLRLTTTTTTTTTTGSESSTWAVGDQVKGIKRWWRKLEEDRDVSSPGVKFTPCDDDSVAFFNKVASRHGWRLCTTSDLEKVSKKWFYLTVMEYLTYRKGRSGFWIEDLDLEDEKALERDIYTSTPYEYKCPIRKDAMLMGKWVFLHKIMPLLDKEALEPDMDTSDRASRERTLKTMVEMKEGLDTRFFRTFILGLEEKELPVQANESKPVPITSNKDEAFDIVRSSASALRVEGDVLSENQPSEVTALKSPQEAKLPELIKTANNENNPQDNSSIEDSWPEDEHDFCRMINYLNIRLLEIAIKNEWEEREPVRIMKRIVDEGLHPELIEDAKKSQRNIFSRLLWR